MAKTVLDLTPDELKKYSFTPKRRPNLAQQKRLMSRAMRQARRASKLLKRDFGASRVVLFGSLAHRQWFAEKSDIDLAVWGIAPGSFFDAYAAVNNRDEFDVNLIKPDECFPSLLRAIEEEGADL